MDRSANAVLGALQTIRVVDFETVEDERRRVVTIGPKWARKVFKALKIQRKPPEAPTEASGTKEGLEICTEIVVRKRGAERRSLSHCLCCTYSINADHWLLGDIHFYSTIPPARRESVVTKERGTQHRESKRPMVARG